MSRSRPKQQKCWACYGSLAYLAGYCPVCNDTGLVMVEATRDGAALQKIAAKAKDHKTESGAYQGFFR